MLSAVQLVVKARFFPPFVGKVESKGNGGNDEEGEQEEDCLGFHLDIIIVMPK